MSWTKPGQLLALSIVAIACGCSTQPRDDNLAARADPVPDVADASALTEEALRDMVMRLADGYFNRLRPVIDRAESIATSPDERYLIHHLKYSAAAAVFDIAVSPRAEEALLDLLVLITLQRHVHERYWGPEIFQARDGGEALSALKRIEQESWRTAQRAMTEQEQAELRGLIDEWLAENPHAIRVDHVRFGDFIHLRNRASANRAGGMLANVKEAAEAIEDIRSFGDRALWMSSRLPILLGYQVEQTLYDVARQQEIMQVARDYGQFVEAADVLAAAVDTLPEDIARERAAFMDELQVRSAELEGAVREMRRTMEAGTELATALNTTVNSVDQVVARFDQKPANPNREPLSMNDLGDAAIETRLAAEQLTAMLAMTNELLESPQWDERLGTLDAAVESVQAGGDRWINLTFRQILIVIGTVFVALVAYRWVSVRLIAPAKPAR
ncbi:MAG: hypothetical protein ACYSU7_05130 [Planctomycetota bacterium]|jgi:hypothetical protein